MQRQLHYLLVSATLFLATCGKPQPGALVDSFLTATGTIKHVSLEIEPLSPAKLPTESSTTLALGHRTIFLSLSPNLLAVNHIVLPIDVHIRGTNLDFFKHCTESGDFKVGDSSPQAIISVQKGAIQRLDIEPHQQVSEIVVLGEEKAMVGESYTIHDATMQFSRSLGAGEVGQMRIGLANESFEADLSNALIKGGYAQNDVLHGIEQARQELQRLSDKELLTDILKSEQRNIINEPDLVRAIRLAYLQWRLDPEWAASSIVGEHEIIIVKRNWHSKEFPTTAFFEEFNSDGSEFTHGSISVIDSPSHQEMMDRIIRSIGEIK